MMIKITFPSILVYDFDIEKNTVFEKEFQVVQENGLPYSLVGKSLRCELKQYPLAATSVVATITIALDQTSGMFTLKLPKTSSFSFDRGFYDLKMKNTSTGDVYSILKGKVRVLPTVTTLT